MDITIFIKTYKADLKWLTYCLASCAKYAPEFPIVIVADEDCKPQLRHLTREKVFYVKPNLDGYLFQQYVKLRAFDYVDTKYILFMDSDCVFTGELEEEHIFRNDKPILLKTNYEEIPEVKFWQDATSEAIGFIPEFEYMRKIALTYHRDTLIRLWNNYSNLFLPKLQSAKNRRFSEFNLIGAYIDKFESELYEIIDTKNEIPYYPVRQFWSYSGLNKEDLNELNTYL